MEEGLENDETCFIESARRSLKNVHPFHFGSMHGAAHPGTVDSAREEWMALSR
jgi:hypothetical protein